MNEEWQIFDSFFLYQVKWMCSGIEATLKEKESFHTCALALIDYTEIMGGLVTGNLKDPTKPSSKNYEAFLPYLGAKYVMLNDDLKKDGNSLYKMIRNKLVHEFSLRESYLFSKSETPNNERCGIEVVRFNKPTKEAIGPELHINIHLTEYYNDFKKGLDKYYDKLKNWKEDQTLLQNFLKCVVQNYQS